jgi:Domain of unknown function (DUF397)
LPIVLLKRCELAKQSQFRITWRRSSSCDTGSCVEFAEVGRQVLMRDSKNPTGPVLKFEPPVWHEFLQGVKAGDFERK